MKQTRILSLLLALVMVLGMLPVSAFATDSTDQTAGEPVVTITHVSLDPTKDALGFKAKVEGDSASVTEIGFAFRVNGGAEKLYTLAKTPEDGIFTARVKNILANNGGEATLEAYAFVVVNGETVNSGRQSTSMKNTLQAVNTAWFTAGYTQTQRSAVKDLCNQYKAQVEDWELDNIFSVVTLSTNYFTDNGNNTYTLTTDSGAEHMVDDVWYNGQIAKYAHYSVKGKLDLTDAADWGQARILISEDSENEYFIALENIGGNYQIFTMSKAAESGWNDWRLIAHCEVNGSRNNLDFEVIVNNGHIAFLVDDKICYESQRVTMSESTVKFTGYNVGTTTVSDLQMQIFDTGDAADSYLATKEKAEYVSRFQTRMDSLYNEYIVEHGCANNGGTLFFGDSNFDFWSTWESQTGLTKYENGYNVGIGGSTIVDWIHAYDQLVKPFNADRFVILAGDNDVNVWGTDGETAVENLKTLFAKLHADHPEAEIYYIYTTPSPSAYANGAYKNPKLGALISGAKELCEGLDYVQGIDMFDLMTTEDKLNSNEALFANDKLHMNAAGYEVFSAHLYELIFKPEYSGFFGTCGDYKTGAQFDLSQDTGANTGTVNVSENGISLGYVDSFREENFYFESKIHINSVKSTENYPKFGLFVQDGGIRHHFYVDMTTALTATKVGRMTVTNGSYDWNNINTAAVSGMAFSGEGEYITMGVLKDGKYLHLFVNGVHALSYESAMTGSAVAGVFGFNTNMTLTEYFTDTTAETLAAKKGMLPRYVQDMGDASVFQYDAATDTITIDMDSSNTRSRAQLYENGFPVEGKCFAVTGHIRIENTKHSGTASSLIEFQAGANIQNYVKIEVYRFESATTSNNSVAVTLADGGNGNSEFGYVTGQNEDGSFNVASGVSNRPNNLPKGDPYEADYMMIFENGTVYFVLDGQLMYRYEGTYETLGYYFGVTQYADATYTNTHATCDVAEVAKLAAPYRNQKGSSLSLTTDHATLDQDAGIYTLDASTMVEETVLKDGVQLNETNYRVSGTLYNNGTADWAQAQIVVKSDDTHAVRFVLERTNKGYYQVFTEHKNGQTNWQDWTAIIAPNNQTINRMNFDVVVIQDTIYLVIDGMVYYHAQYAGIFDSSFVTIGGQSISMTVSNLCGEVFADAAAAQAYADEKPAYQYISNYSTSINNRYNEYFGTNVVTQPGGTLLLGSSQIHFWGVDTYCGANSWTNTTGLLDHITGYNVGIGGTCIEDWLYAYDKLIAPFNASRFIIHLGGNDMWVKDDTGANTAKEMQTLLEKIHADFPDSEIYYLYTLPAPNTFANGKFNHTEYTVYGDLMDQYCNDTPWVTGLDVGSVLLTADGQSPNKDLFYQDGFHMNEAGYKAWYDYLYEHIFKNDPDRFFGKTGAYSTTAHVNLNQDTGAHTGTTTVSENGIAFGYVNDFEEENFYFETKIHVNGIKSTENYPKFGLFVRGSESVRHNFYVDMKTDLTATVVGRMTNTNGSDNWSDVNKATVSNLAFSGEGEYITMGVLKDGKYLHLFVDGKHVLSYESEFTGAAMAGVFSFNTGMTLTEYYTDTNAETLAAKKALIPRYIQDMGDTSVFQYDAVTDTITIDMDSSKTRSRAQLYENGIPVEGTGFAVTGHIKIENTKHSGGYSSLIEFQAGADAQNYVKIEVYRFESATTTNNSVAVTMKDAGNGQSAYGYVTGQNEDGSFNVASGVSNRPNNLPKGDPYEADYKVIFENGTVYFILDGQLMYRYEGTYENLGYYFGVTQYADATYTDTQVTYDAEEIAEMTAAYK